ncbi:ribonuclease H-like domain-containing protein [Tanacetum coccineum]
MTFDEFKFKANEGNWRLCVAEIVGTLKGRLGRMSAAEPEIESFDKILFLKNKIFVSKEKELAECDKINIDEYFSYGALEGNDLMWTLHSLMTLVPRPTNANIVRCMWLFRHTYLADGTLSRYKACLVANDSTQIKSVDVDETFCPVVKPGVISIFNPYHN